MATQKVEKKMKENEGKWSRREKVGDRRAESSSRKFIAAKVIDFLQTLTQLIYGSEQGKLQKKTKIKSYHKDKYGRNKKLKQKHQSVKKQVNSGCRMNSG